MRNFSLKSWRGLPAQLFLLIILPFAVLALAVALMSLGLHQEAMRSMLAERDVKAAKTSAAFLSNRIADELNYVKGLAAYIGAAAGEDHQAALDVYAKVHEAGYRNLALVDADGNLLAKTGTSLAAYKPASPDEGIALVKLDERPVLAFWKKVDDRLTAQEFVPVDELGQEVLSSSFDVHDHGSAFIISAQYGTLYQLGDMEWEGDIQTHPGVREALAGKSGSTYVQSGANEHVVAYSSISPVGWALIIEEPWQMVDSGYLRLTQFAPLLLIPVLALVMVALWFGITQIVTPLQKLEAQSTDLAWGNFEAIEKPVGGILEIRQLQNGLIHLAGKVQTAQRSLHDYIGAMTTGQEDERRRLARELHDDTLQSLIALHQRVQLARMKAGDDQTRQALTDLETLSNTTIDDLRRLTRALRPSYLEDLGLVTALEMLAREVKEANLLEVNFERQGTEERLEPGVELSLYRIAQEALSNITRHSGAKQATLRINFAPGELLLEVKDDGKGFTPPRSPAEFAPGGHYGLLGMFERAELIGARLSIESTAGKGTTLRVMLGEPSI
ncbi:MAG TPA: histidine kinase [Anaerolineales bacterium]|jgi:signal transduction histidine kinase